MPEVRRFLFQSLSLVCEQLSHSHKHQPYQLVIKEIIGHLTTVADSEMSRLAEEVYELLADCCLF